MEQGAPRTRLELLFISTDFAATSHALAYRDAIDAKQGDDHGQPLVARRTVDGRPQDAERHAELTIEDGRLRDIEPGAGRMLGLLSVAQLPRRLALDFRDVTDEGLAFNSIKGDFEVRAGNAFTQNLLVRGAAVDMGIVGRTGLATEDYDQTIVVSGNPSGPLAVAGALAAGPVIGAGVLVLSQLFKDQLQGLTRAYYHVTGPWAAPVVQRISAPVGDEAGGRGRAKAKGRTRRDPCRRHPDDFLRQRGAQPRRRGRPAAAGEVAGRGRRRAAGEFCVHGARRGRQARGRRDPRLRPDPVVPGRAGTAARACGSSAARFRCRCPANRASRPRASSSTTRGREVARYDKIHLFDVDVPGKLESHRESKAVRPGAHVVTVDTPGGPARSRRLLRRAFSGTLPRTAGAGRRVVHLAVRVHGAHRTRPLGTAAAHPRGREPLLPGRAGAVRIPRERARNPRRFDDRRALGPGPGPIAARNRRDHGRIGPRAAAPVAAGFPRRPAPPALPSPRPAQEP